MVLVYSPLIILPRSLARSLLWSLSWKEYGHDVTHQSVSYNIPPLCGCESKRTGSEESKPTAADYRAIRQVYKSFHNQLLGGDIEVVLANVNASPEMQEVIRSVHEYAGTLLEFKQRVDQAYGEGGWKEFFKSTESTGSDEMQKLSTKALEKSPIIFEGSSVAFLWTAKDKEWIRLERITGEWKVDGDDLMTSENYGNHEILNSLSAIFKENIDQIGKEGVTAKALSQRIGAEFFNVMFSEMVKDPKPEAIE